MKKSNSTLHTQVSRLQSIGLATIFVLLGTGVQPGCASQDFQPGARKPFSLQAEVDDQIAPPSQEQRPQLSRQDVAVVPPQAQPPMARFDIGADQGVTLPEQPQRAQTPSPPQERPASSMLEYGVDWSRWVSALADRWYFNLKNLEDRSGLQFHTVRPCLIKFTCYPNGAIAEMTLKQSSGVPMYDQLQAQALLQCQPVAPFPQGTQRTNFTLVQGWESHPRKHGESDYRPGSFGRGFPVEVVKQWMNNMR
jgi:hypothetical protein